MDVLLFLGVKYQWSCGLIQISLKLWPFMWNNLFKISVIAKLFGKFHQMSSGIRFTL